MKLNRRYRRNIKANLSFYIAATVLTIVALFMFYLYNITGNGINQFSDKFFADNNIEDGEFTTYKPIPDDEITDLEQDYDVQLEKQEYINVEEKKYTARVFDKNKKINRYEITQGEDISGPGEIIISEGYAVNKKVDIGDAIKLDGESYKVTGYFQRPDYLYMLESPDDNYKNISSFFLAYVDREDFKELGAKSIQYYVTYDKKSEEKAFRKEVNDSYKMKSYLSASENSRITMVTSQADLFISVSYLVLVVVPLIAVVIISVTLSRKVKQEQRVIGTLTAMGYKRGKLMRHYTGFAVIPGLIGGIIPCILSFALAQSYGEMGLADYEPMHIDFKLSPITAILGIIVPTLLYILAALLSTRKLLKNDPVTLLHGSAGAKTIRRKLLVNSKMSFRKKFALRSILGNPARSLVVILGIFLGSFIMLFGFSVLDSTNALGDTVTKQLGTYQYEYVLNQLQTEKPDKGEPILTSNMESEDGASVPIIGTDENKYITLKDTDGNDVSLDDGFYVTKTTAYLYDLEKGDTYTVYNPLTMEKEKIKVEGVLNNDVQKGIYTSRASAEDLLNIDEGSYNAIISDKKLDLDKDDVAETIKMSSIKEQSDTLMDQMAPIIMLFIVIGVIICISAIFVAVNMLMTENRHNISMLKVLGYRNGKINKVVLHINHILVPIGILLSIPLVYALGDAFFRTDIENTGMIVHTVISARSYILSILLTLASYFGSIAIIGRKIRKVSMVESLKDNRE